MVGLFAVTLVSGFIPSSETELPLPEVGVGAFLDATRRRDDEVEEDLAVQSLVPGFVLYDVQPRGLQRAMDQFWNTFPDRLFVTLGFYGPLRDALFLAHDDRIPPLLSHMRDVIAELGLPVPDETPRWDEGRGGGECSALGEQSSLTDAKALVLLFMLHTKSVSDKKRGIRYAGRKTPFVLDVVRCATFGELADRLLHLVTSRGAPRPNRDNNSQGGATPTPPTSIVGFWRDYFVPWASLVPKTAFVRRFRSLWDFLLPLASHSPQSAEQQPPASSPVTATTTIIPLSPVALAYSDIISLPVIPFFDDPADLALHDGKGLVVRRVGRPPNLKKKKRPKKPPTRTQPPRSSSRPGSSADALVQLGKRPQREHREAASLLVRSEHLEREGPGFDPPPPTGSETVPTAPIVAERERPAEKRPRVASAVQAPRVRIAVSSRADTARSELQSRDGPRRFPWSPEEDAALTRCVAGIAPELLNWNWATVAHELQKQGFNRVGKQCRERWNNRLSPDVRLALNHPWTVREKLVLIEAQRAVGNHWTHIAQQLPGRSENGVKNMWHMYLAPEIEASHGGSVDAFVARLRLEVASERESESESASAPPPTSISSPRPPTTSAFAPPTASVRPLDHHPHSDDSSKNAKNAPQVDTGVEVPPSSPALAAPFPRSPFAFPSWPTTPYHHQPPVAPSASSFWPAFHSSAFWWNNPTMWSEMYISMARQSGATTAADSTSATAFVDPRVPTLAGLDLNLITAVRSWPPHSLVPDGRPQQQQHDPQPPLSS